MNSLILEIWPYLLGLLGVVAGVVGGYMKGKSTAEDKRNAETLKAVRQTKEVRENVESMDDDQLIAEFDRLHNRHRR